VAIVGRVRRVDRLRLLVGVQAAAGLVVLAVAAALAGTPPQVDLLVVGLLLLVLGALPLLHLRWGHHRESLNFVELSLVFGLVLLPLPWFVLMSAAAAGAAHVLVNRLGRIRVSLVKILYNASTAAVGVGGVGLLLEAVGVDPSTAKTEPLGSVAVGSAVLLYALFQGLCVSAAVTVTQSTGLWSTFVAGLRLRLLVSLGNTVLALALLWLAGFQPQSLVAVPPFLILLFIAYRAYLATREERDVWRRLEESTRAVTSLDEPRVIRAALRAAVELFRADRAEIVIDGPQGEHRYTATRSDLAEAKGGVPIWAETRLGSARVRFGQLRVGLDGSVRLSERERAVLAAFGHTVSAAIENARLYADLRRQAQRSAHAAAHDELTGLPNRGCLRQRAQEVFGAGDHASAALLLVDLDHFKEINDTLGHTAGDRLLREVAHRLRRAVRDCDLVARLGGDEFAVLLPDVVDPRAAESVAADLLRVLSDPVESEGLRLAVEGSIGIAMHPQDAATFEELLQRADVALYQAKTSRGSWRRYDPAHDDSSVHRLALVAELRGALARDELVLHFQPQIDLTTGEVVAAEALARWQHPRRGLLHPADFVPAAEHSGLVRAFTVAVLSKAVAECAEWRREGRDVRVAVNLSARSLLDHELPHDVAAALRRYQLPADRLVVEITETVVMSELEVVEEVLAALRALGVRLSVDDFGTGYSSLAFLRRVAVNEVKIDKSFVLGMARSRDDAAIVRATIQLAASLGLVVVAEGVESEPLRRSLAELGCDVAQGYHLGRPEPAAAMRGLLGLGESHRTTAPLQVLPRLTRLSAS
jgi:diguanylate cyclase (GGDEF)-like protein